MMSWMTTLAWLVVAWALFGWHGPSDWAEAQWIETLPAAIRSCILWSADHEEGSLYDWHYEDEHDAGGGIFNTGGDEVEAIASPEVVHSGQFAAKATITNATRAQNGSRAVRLMRWTDAPWSEGGTFFPDVAYYSVWMYFPLMYNPNKLEAFDPGDGGWWNVFQFKSNDSNSRNPFNPRIHRAFPLV
ncbi:hypothetical protein, partial [Candidatus Entotheonella palauensis]|uniref:hypothetical protein n=1 Tax=Candidatus Entotheonella palauensis TaxID=93172 RepID=UPI001177CD9F